MEENNPDNTPQTEPRSAGEIIKKYAKRVWSYLKVAKMEYIVMVSLFALDLISKAIINATIDVGESVTVIPKFLVFYNTHNYNAAFGSEFIRNILGSMGSRIMFSIFAVVASVVFVLILIRAKGGNKLFRISLAMLTAGAMGNCIDRMFLGYVRDFVQIVYFGFEIGGSTSFYIFNIADAELVIGVILVIIYFIFLYHDKPKEEHAKPVPANESADVTVSNGATVEDPDGDANPAADESVSDEQRRTDAELTADGEDIGGEPQELESKISDEIKKEGDDA